jgi:hypothetical protein
MDDNRRKERAKKAQENEGEEKIATRRETLEMDIPTEEDLDHPDLMPIDPGERSAADDVFRIDDLKVRGGSSARIVWIHRDGELRLATELIDQSLVDGEYEYERSPRRL